MKVLGDRNLIYKYASVNEFTYQNLILKRLWFNPPNLMNDQLEGLIRIHNTDFTPSSKAIKKFINDKQLNKKGALEYIRINGFIDFYMMHWFHYELRKFGISCFSKKNNEPLMWAHYADKHRGICLVYDKKIILEHLRVSDYKVEMETISYGKMPTITLSENSFRINYQSDMPIISAKNENWKYEQEVRFLFQTYNTFSGDSLPIGATPLKAIIYGYRISADSKNTISEILSNDRQYENVKEYNAEINYSNGHIEIIED